MQKILITDIQPHTVLGRDIFDSRGRLLVSTGTRLTQKMIQRMTDLGIAAVYAKNDLWNAVEVPEVVRDEVRRKARRSIQSVFDSIQQETPLDVYRVRKTAGLIIDEILANPHALVHLTDIRTLDGYTLGHSVNVCVLSVMVGVKMQYDPSRLHDMATGALLHDVGKLAVPITILNKPGNLTADEFDIMKEHAVRGYEMLRKQHHDLSYPAIHIAFQHHEKYDGSGYPRGLQKTEIHEFSRIVAIADVYDALTTERVYKKAFLPHEAYEIMKNSTYTHFDPELLQVFLGQIAVYPVSSVLVLNNGDIGIVTQVPEGLPARPVVRLIFDKNINPYPPELTVDLREHLTTFVEKVLTEEETALLLAQHRRNQQSRRQSFIPGA
ncbi:MAG TPA: HD-GYP domain-containing protein [Patescibacteria group bacterium]|nr:HD-GYP domain-containing protein [Patescibacteria group bacterium]